MRKKIICLTILTSLFIILQLFLVSKKNNYSINYNIDNFLVTEEYNYKIKNGYYINIIDDNHVYSYQFYSPYIGKKIITGIKQYEDKKDDCILPLFNNEVMFDITCNIDKELSSGIYQIYLHNMHDASEELTKFASSIKEYDINKFKDNSKINKIDIYDIYYDNLLNNYSVETYRGIINNNKKIDVFDNDKYNKFSFYTKNYYVVPDYESDYEFNKLYVINLKNNKVKTFKLNYNISYISYIQGIDGDIVYLFDLDNKSQYKIDIKNFDIKKIGNLNNNIEVYEDGKWVKKSVSEIVENKPSFNFGNYQRKIEGNICIDSVGDNIYTYIKSDDGYKAYKSNKYTSNIKNYLFTIDDIDNIIYDGDYFYFKKDNYIAYYSENTGIKKIIQGNELLFNKNILFKIIL